MTAYQKASKLSPEAELEQANSTLAAAKEALGAAVRKDRKSPTADTAEAVRQARAIVTAAQDALLDAEAGLRAHRQEEAALAAEQTRKNLMASCARVLELQQQREHEGADVDRLAGQLVAALSKLAGTSAELYRALEPLLPRGSAQIVREAAVTEPGLLTAHLRVHLAALGWKWICGPALHGSKTSFAQRIEDSGRYLKTILPPAAE
jgi:hypothetical protein